MIPEKFYTTGSVGEIETTSELSAITDENFLSDFAYPYLMGYATPENTPACLSPIKITHSAGELTLSPEPLSNIGWGYCVRNFQAYAGAIVTTDGETMRRYSPVSTPQIRFINDIEMSRVVNQGQITITFFAEFIQNGKYVDGVGTDGFVRGGTDAGSVLPSRFFTETYNITDFIDICKNDGVLIDRVLTNTGSASPIYNIPFHIELTANDFPRPENSDDLRGVFLDFTATAGCHVFVAIAGYSFAFPQYVHSDDTETALQLVPFSAFSADDKKHMYIPPVEPTNQAMRCKYNKTTHIFSDFSPVGDSQRPAYAYDSVDGYILGGFNFGKIDETDGINDIVYPGKNYGIRRNYYVEYEGISGDVVTLRIQSIYSLYDVYNFVLLWHKHAVSQSDISPSYNNNIYTTFFTQSDEYSGEYMNGTLTDISARLRPWQFPAVSITANRFTPDDIPTPDQDADSTGDDIHDTDFNNITIGAGNNFVTLYGMTSAGVSDMGEKLWASLSDPTYWQTVGTVFTNDFSINPADMLKYFLSLRYFPFNLGALPHGTSDGVFIGRATAPLLPSAGVASPIRMQKSIAQLDGGRLTIRRKFNDFRDFEPCTTVQIHVPFCGTVDVPASEVVGKTLYLTYKIDLQTGAMLGVIAVQSNTYYVIATVAGSCGASIPITANNNIEFLQRIATVAGSGFSGGISGGIKGASVGGEVGAVAGAIAGSIGGGVGALAGLPPVTVHKQGNASGFANLGGVPCAYVTIQRQRYSVPENYGHTTGYACDVSETIGNLSGFAVCENVDTSGLTCNATERAEIKRLLESGIYI